MRCLINAGNACVLGQRRLPCYDVLLYRVCHCCSIFQPPSPFIFERYSRRLERTRATCADKRHEKWTWRDEGKWYEVWLTPNFVARTFRRRNIKHRAPDIFLFSCTTIFEDSPTKNLSQRRHVASIHSVAIPLNLLWPRRGVIENANWWEIPLLETISRSL